MPHYGHFVARLFTRRLYQLPEARRCAHDDQNQRDAQRHENLSIIAAMPFFIATDRDTEIRHYYRRITG